MSEQSSSQEKTEQATPKRLDDARKKGQVATSRDLNSLIILLTGSIGFIVFGEQIIHQVSEVARQTFTISRQQLFDSDYMITLLQSLLTNAIWIMLPLLFLFIIGSMVGPLTMSGGTLNVNSLKFQFSKLSPLKGLKRIFAVRGLVELIKTLAKFSVVTAVALLIMWYQFPHLLVLSQYDAIVAMTNGLSRLSWAFLGISSGLLLIALIDVPYQLWEHFRQLKMTKQEIKDEYKDIEGKPEVKAHIRKVQQELAKQRMMEEVPKADVIITNPTHFAVALRYEEQGETAPRVVAKGKDLVAANIREIAKQHNVPLVSAPPLARAIFFSTKLNHEIPRALFVAVAQALA